MSKITNIIIYSLVILIMSTHSLQAQAKINQFNSKGERIGVWKKKYNNGRIRYVGQFENGKEVGTFRYYSAKSSKFPIVIKTFIRGTNLAKVKFYTEEGVMESKGEMEGKKRIGKWVYYNTDGKSILSEESYMNGLLNGEAKTYYASGKITEILNYKNGKLHGNIKRFADNGNLLDDLNYVDGKLQGLAKYYNLQGKLIYRGAYDNDERIGKWEYFENGKPIDSIKLKQLHN